ncbi:tetratricopeptide repeat protein [Flavobacterium sp. W20_MBD1_R3]|uniref:tetratricopeptide repeat protein n=1 Tax=Flavobacterium sp. W20_MBD1_R3 TaxID=3240278 RepID=UPI003F8E57D0
MNVSDYNYLINKPNTVHREHTAALEKILEEFPYFQSARALQLKGLFNEDSYKYNGELKITAAFTTDRSVLFDFITSDTFTSITKSLYDAKAREILNLSVIESEIIPSQEKKELKLNPAEQSILTLIKEATPAAVNSETTPITEKIDLGKPLDFSAREQHSFQEWLQLSRTEPIEREKEDSENPSAPLNEEKRKKLDLINKFIETSPKISPVKHGIPSSVNLDLNAADNSYLMTETLARVYLEQKKYQKAIQAYEILILKYPEKSSFFADRITDIKILQHNNN